MGKANRQGGPGAAEKKIPYRCCGECGAADPVRGELCAAQAAKVDAFWKLYDETHPAPQPVTPAAAPRPAPAAPAGVT